MKISFILQCKKFLQVEMCVLLISDNKGVRALVDLESAGCKIVTHTVPSLLPRVKKKPIRIIKFNNKLTFYLKN